MLVIDVHAHFFRTPGEPEAGTLAGAYNQGLLEGADDLGIDYYCGNLAVPSSLTPGIEELPKPHEFIIANRWMKEWMDQYPSLILGFAYVNPVWVEESIQQIEYCKEELGMVGVKLLRSIRCNDPRSIEVVRRVGELGLPVLQHTDHYSTRPGESGTDDVAALARECPDTTIIAAHMPGGLFWEYSTKMLRKSENVFLGCSGSVPEMGIIEYMVDQVGADRMVFGTDGSMCPSAGRILGADISDEDKEKIMGKNMARILEPLTGKLKKRPRPLQRVGGKS